MQELIKSNGGCRKMRKNNSIREYDKVYIDLPQRLNYIRRLTVCPLKTIYINCSADCFANVERIFRTVDDLERFIYQNDLADIFI